MRVLPSLRPPSPPSPRRYMGTTRTPAEGIDVTEKITKMLTPSSTSLFTELPKLGLGGRAWVLLRVS